MMFLGRSFQLRSHRPEKAVAEQNADKGTHEGRADVMPQNRGRRVDLAHRQHHAEHAGDDTHARHGFGHVRNGVRRQEFLIFHDLHVGGHEVVDIFRSACRQIDAQRVPDEVDRCGIFGNAGMFCENGTGFRFSTSLSMLITPSRCILVKSAYSRASVSR